MGFAVGSVSLYDVLLPLDYVFAGVDRSGYFVYEIGGAKVFVGEVFESRTGRGRAGAGTCG